MQVVEMESCRVDFHLDDEGIKFQFAPATRQIHPKALCLASPVAEAGTKTAAT
jgi:hypothetical protein